MQPNVDLEIEPQPNDSSCGPTCLAAVYRYWNDPVDLFALVHEIGQLGGGGTLAVQLACHALRRGYDSMITTYNLQLFDPTWFRTTERVCSEFLSSRLTAQLQAKRGRSDIDLERFATATSTYLEYLSLGGRVQMPPLDHGSIIHTLSTGVPILCGLSATYLYQESRERSHAPNAAGKSSIEDDIGGYPVGHFVVLYGYDPVEQQVLIADPLHPNPLAATHKYRASMTLVVSAILLGIVTYDANLLAIVPRNRRAVGVTL